MPRKRSSKILNLIGRVLISFFSIFANCKCRSRCCECKMETQNETARSSSPIFLEKEIMGGDNDDLYEDDFDSNYIKDIDEEGNVKIIEI